MITFEVHKKLIYAQERCKKVFLPIDFARLKRLLNACSAFGAFANINAYATIDISYSVPNSKMIKLNY